MATTEQSDHNMATLSPSHNKSPPASSLDNDAHDMKHLDKAEASYLEHGIAADEEDFKRKEKALVKKLDLCRTLLVRSKPSS